ncbi:MAG: ABC transporter substrate-binding protein [Chloroflexota bacterium]
MSNWRSGSKLSRRELLKSLALVGLAIGTGVSLATGCAAQQAPAAPTKAAESTKPDLDKAKQEGVVSLYTSLDTAIVDMIIKPFKEKYGIDVKYYRGTGPDVTTKILTEWDAKQYLCDVFDVSDLPGVLVMKKRDMLVKYLAASIDAYPADMKDKDGYWTADRLTQVILGYNTNSIKGADIPTGWGDLADPKYGGKLVMQVPNLYYPRIHTVVTHLKDGWAWLEKVGKNKVKFVQSVQIMGQMNETGEIPLSIFQNDNIIARSRDNGKPVQPIFPKEGFPTAPGSIALMGKSPHPNAGKLLIDWWLGEEGQKANVAGYKYSPRPDIAPPKGCPPLKDLTLWQDDLAYLDANLTEVGQKIDKALGA